MAEPENIPILISILANLIAVWSLIKSFRTQRTAQMALDRLAANRKMVETAHKIAQVSYNKSKQLEAWLDEAEQYGDEAVIEGEEDGTDYTEGEQPEGPGPRFRPGY